jgi:hypothetical protein
MRGVLNMDQKMKLDTSRTSHFSVRRRMTLLGLVGVGAATIAIAGVMTATPATVSGIILLVGANESQRVVNWYASADTHQVVQVAPRSEFEHGDFPHWATTYPAVVTANTANGGFNGHENPDDPTKPEASVDRGRAAL